MKHALIMCLAAFFANVAMSAHHEKTEVTFATQEVAPKLYMIYGVGGFAGGNMALSVGSDGPVMIDDSMPSMLDKLNQTVSAVAKSPIAFLINTHVHGDHTGNNASFAEKGTHILAHENLRSRMLAKTEAGKMGRQALPVITFNDAMTLHFNDTSIRAIHVANAHTDGDSIVFFPKENVIHAGDVFFNNMFPFIDIKSGGSVDGFIKAQGLILKMADEKTKIIPGHGKLASKADLERDRAMLIKAKTAVQTLVKAGQTEEQVVQAEPLKQFHSDYNWSFITTEKMTRQLYKDLAAK